VPVARVADALAKLRQSPFDLDITAGEGAQAGGIEMLKALRDDKQFELIPILGLVEQENQLYRKLPEGLVFYAWLVRSQRQKLLGCVSNLLRKEQYLLEAVV